MTQSWNSAKCHDPLDVIIDTDIGTDVDDAYALLFALSSPELSVRAVTLVHADLDTRAKIALKILTLLGHTSIPVAKGCPNPLNPARPLCWGGHEGRGIDFSDISECQMAQGSASELIARIAAENPQRLVLITIGPMTNAAIAIQRFPDLKYHLKEIVAMASVFNGFGAEKAGVEHNIALDPEAADIVFQSGVPTRLVGLNVTTQARLTKEQINEIQSANTKLAGLFGHMTNEWLAVTNRDYAIMHDPLAVCAAFDGGVVDFIPVRPEVSLDNPGAVSYYPANTDSTVLISQSLNVQRFMGIFYPRILSAVCGGNQVRRS